MSQCVKVWPTGTPIAVSGFTVLNSSRPFLGVDDSCASGLRVYTDQEIDQLKQTIRVDSATDPERVADMQALFYAFLAVLVVVWGIKQLANLFTGDTSRD